MSDIQLRLAPAVRIPPLLPRNNLPIRSQQRRWVGRNFQLFSPSARGTCPLRLMLVTCPGFLLLPVHLLLQNVLYGVENRRGTRHKGTALRCDTPPPPQNYRPPA